MELTRTDVVFSRIAMVLFLCRNNSSQNGTKLREDFFISIIRIFGAKTHQRGPPGWATPTRARPPLLARLGGLSPPGGPADPETNAINSYFRKKIREKKLLRSRRWSHRQALFFLGRADLESVLGSGEGKLSPSSSSTILHHQFHDAHHRV